MKTKKITACIFYFSLQYNSEDLIPGPLILNLTALPLSSLTTTMLAIIEIF